ncbi:MAG TPA: DUF6671 family protein, partial [Coleofasciculaceae cyanobacterium]
YKKHQVGANGIRPPESTQTGILLTCRSPLSGHSGSHRCEDRDIFVGVLHTSANNGYGIGQRTHPQSRAFHPAMHLAIQSEDFHLLAKIVGHALKRQSFSEAFNESLFRESQMIHPFFANRVGVLATMHRKEKVIAPILEQELGIQLQVPENLNTDRFGTFTRDRDRPGDQRSTARLKAESALDLTGESLAIASEGSFGPHPSLPMIACNRELIVLVDRVHKLEIFGQEISIETNYRYTTVRSVEEAQIFAQTIGFPEHGLVVMPDASTQNPHDIVKGIVSEAELLTVVTEALRRSPTLHLETDMRALYNPTRMNVIAKAAINLVAVIQSACPQCTYPGFEPVEYRTGLPCALCHFPTALTRVAIYHCQHCGFRQEKLFPDGIEAADPAQCQYCNP